jgi:ankyrin repeat protein
MGLLRLFLLSTSLFPLLLGCLPSGEDVAEEVCADSGPGLHTLAPGRVVDHQQVLAGMRQTGCTDLIYKMKRDGYSLDGRNADGRTLLMLAAEANMSNLVLALLLAGVDVELGIPSKFTYCGGWTCYTENQDKGQTAETLAQKAGHIGIVRLLKSLVPTYSTFKLLRLGQSGQTNVPIFSLLPTDLVNEIAKLLFILNY